MTDKQSAIDRIDNLRGFVAEMADGAKISARVDVLVRSDNTAEVALVLSFADQNYLAGPMSDAALTVETMEIEPPLNPRDQISTTTWRQC